MFQFPRFASNTLCIQVRISLKGMGFPIRKSPDQSLFDSYPRLIAAYHVLLRLITPRHPPCTLSSLATFAVGPLAKTTTDGLGGATIRRNHFRSEGRGSLHFPPSLFTYQRALRTSPTRTLSAAVGFFIAAPACSRAASHSLYQRARRPSSIIRQKNKKTSGIFPAVHSGCNCCSFRLMRA